MANELSNPLIDQFIRSIEEPTAPESNSAIELALAERARRQAAQGFSGPNILPSQATQDFAQLTPQQAESIASTAGYAGPTRPSDRPGDIPQNVVIRGGGAQEEARLAALPGAPGRTVGELMNLLLAGKNASPEGKDALMRGLGLDVQDSRIEAARLAAGNRGSAAAERANTQRINNIGIYFNKQTGAPAVESFVDRPPTGEELVENFVPLKSEQQRKDLSAINNLDADIQAYKEAIANLDLPAKASLTGRIKQGVTVPIKSFIGESKIADLEAVQARIMNVGRAFGGTSKNVDTEAERRKLEKAIPSALAGQDTADTVIRQLEKFRDVAAKTIPIPGIQNRYKEKASVSGGESEQRSKAQALVAQARQQLGGQATPQQIRDLARQLQAGQ